MLTLSPSYASPLPLKLSKKSKFRTHFHVCANGFPSFLPKEIDNIKDKFARNLAQRIQRLPVQLTSSGTSIMSSCVRPMVQGNTDPIVLLHGFDSSCLEWRYTYPLLEEAGLESWAIDILGWGFSDLGLQQCDAASKRNHLYQFWKSYIKRPMILVGPSLGAVVAIDLAVNHPEAVSKLILIDASVYSEGTGEMAKLPRLFAYAGVALLKSVPLRLYVNLIAFNDVSFNTSLDWMKIGRLHCLYPWWEDAAVNFMTSGGYNVVPLINQVKQQTLIIWGEDDQIISYKLAFKVEGEIHLTESRERANRILTNLLSWTSLLYQELELHQKLHSELQGATLRQIPDCGHIPHVEKPTSVADLIIRFVQ
ncbi:alpha/beta hydrolase domain-containing protein VTE7 isoform X2 [Beta vulgaris subsp. vulgaris]|uniref:alpha/beta hydrolase domain-containing protein VTE7 isoform X2 n=1 Tax=Beta vulgaris subsp. vulgaris TaxID=3555 RepID=UPI002036ECCA|nr:alpha/beta hydrolase domain-containing protein VTE7 isoform X2 [Beta vulgaris subsp. vulgaris]